MTWLQVLVITFGNIAWMLPLFCWLRSESRADARHFDQETKEIRREMIDIMRGFQSSIDAIQQEIKDFHGRLCKIEADRSR